MTPLPLSGAASPPQSETVKKKKSYKTEPEVEPEAEQHLVLSGGDKRTNRERKKKEKE